MFKKLIQGIQEAVAKATKGRVQVDPVEQFGDPVAGEVEWGPCKRGGSNFRTRKLVEVDIDRVKFNATLGAKVFSLIFALGSIIWFLPFFLPMKNEDNFGVAGYFFCSLGGLIFLGAGVGLWIAFTKPITFDRSAGFYWRGRQSPEMLFGDVPDSKKFVPLDQIYALQIISEYCRSSGKNSSSYHSYELNLVLNDRTRVNVVDHGKYSALRTDAETLAAFLEVPLWDQVGGGTSQV